MWDGVQWIRLGHGRVDVVSMVRFGQNGVASPEREQMTTKSARLNKSAKPEPRDYHQSSFFFFFFRIEN